MTEENEDLLRYRHLSVAFWDDERIRDLCSDQKLLAVHLITGPHQTSLPGLFCVGRAQLAEQLRWTIEALDVAWGGLPTWTLHGTLREGFEEPFEKGFETVSRTFPERSGERHFPFAIADWRARLVWMPMSVKHAPPANPNVVTHWRKCFDELPNCALKRGGIAGVRAHLALMPPGFAKAFDQAFEHFAKPFEAGLGNQPRTSLDSGSGSGSGARTRTVSRKKGTRTDEAGVATTKRAIRKPSPAETAYAAAYSAGIQAGSGHAYHCQARPGSILGPAMALHALSEADRSPLTGDPLIGWLKATSEVFARHVGHEAQFWAGLAPVGFVKWLNSGCPDRRQGGARNGKASTAQVTEDRDLADMLIEHGRAGWEQGQS